MPERDNESDVSGGPVMELEQGKSLWSGLTGVSISMQAVLLLIPQSVMVGFPGMQMSWASYCTLLFFFHSCAPVDSITSVPSAYLY